MGYQALYRVWRPQTFEDVIGQEHITRTLQNALVQQKTSHAYLFSGPRGTGKTSAAKILAKAVNCEHSPVSEPCNECASCKGITDGTISDVLEIDAASNNGVEEIRDIRDKVKYAPSSVPYKVYIIDEVHMLSTGAFNALLKTLEEPPKHVIFILATTEPHKIPLTIISRCQRFDFKRITPNDIVGRMETILDETAVQYEDNAIQVIARAAEGGMRDALSLLDQAISFGTDKVTTHDALTVTGSVSQELLSKMVQSIYEQNTVACLQTLHSLLDSGKDPLRFVDDILLYYRDMLLYQTAPELEHELERVLIDDQFITLSKEVRAEQLYIWIEEWNKSIQEMKWSNHPKIFLEVLLVKLCQGNTSEAPASDNQVAVLLERINRLETDLSALKKNGVPVIEQDQGTAQSVSVKKSTGKSNYRAPVGRINNILKLATKKELQNLKNQWGQMLEALAKQQKRSQAALLNDAEPVASATDAFVLKFKYEIHCQMAMSNQELLNLISSTLQQISGQHYDIVGVPDEHWQRIRQDFLALQKSNQPEHEEQEQNDDPLISKARELFGDELLEIKE